MGKIPHLDGPRRAREPGRRRGRTGRRANGSSPPCWSGTLPLTWGHGRHPPILALDHPRRARVLFYRRPVGTLQETATSGATRFTYAPAYLAAPDARPISPTLPLTLDPYESHTLHPFFANLLPEGHMYAATARRLGLARTDRFGMLLHVGGDVMGAVQVFPMESG